MSNQKPTSFLSTISKGLKQISLLISNFIDRLLYSKRFLAVVSLAIALLFFISIQYSQQLATQITQAAELQAPVQVEGNLEEYEISSVPQSVNVVVTGSIVDVRTVQNSNNYAAVLNISNLNEGQHRIRLDRKGFSPTLKVVFSPEFIDVTISRKVSASFEVEPSFINTDKLEPQYILNDPVFENKEVIIHTSQEKLSRISKVVALIDVTNKTESFVSDAKIVAYDQDGLAMDVDIEPEVVPVSVAISSPSRQVAVNVTPVGDIPNNMAISSIELDYPSITLYGPESILNNIASVNIPINASTLTQEVTELKHTIIRPEGVRSMDVESLNIVINLGPKVTKDVEKSQIFFENNVNNYGVIMKDGSEMAVDVTLAGTQERVDGVNPSDIKVQLDMNNITIGTQTVTLDVSGPDPLVKYDLKQKTIEVEITEKGE